MSKPVKTNILLALVLFVVAGSTLLVWFLMPPTDPIVLLMEQPERRPGLLADLISRNGIHGLPSDFRVPDAQYISCSRIEDGHGQAYLCAGVIYPAGERGSRGYCFIFDSSGRCVFHSPDQLMRSWRTLANPYDMFFWDITGDGFLEKVVRYYEWESTEIQNDKPRARFGTTLEVWRITAEKPRLLLSVSYREAEGPDPLYREPRLWWPGSTAKLITVPPPGSAAAVIQLVHFPDAKPLAEFRWSSARQMYETDKRASESWKVTYPADAENDESTNTETTLKRH